MPPGPPGWPLVGNFLAVRKHLRHKGHLGDLAMDLHKKYGPIITIRFGPVPVIVIGEASIVHEALVQRGVLFGSRPAVQSEPIFTRDYHYINSAAYGPFWRSMRRNIVSVMLQLSRVNAFKPMRDFVLASAVERIRDEAAANDGVVEFFPLCRSAIFKILLFMCFGWHIEDSMAACLDDVQHRVFKSQSDLILGENIFDRSRHMKERRMLRQKIVALSTLVIEEHNRRQSSDGGIFPGNYMDSLFELPPHEGGKKLTNIQIFTLCSEFIAAGTDPTAICLEWVLTYLVLHPDVQARCYTEVEEAMVGGRPVEEEDVEKMSYLQATIMETLRLRPPGHFTLPHAVTEPCKLAGYDIPTNALINVHLAAISRDPSIWVDPMQFKPERFLGRETDMTGSKKVEMIPFGAGRRVCPGSRLAMLHAGVVVAKLLEAFEWSSGLEGEQLVMDTSEKAEFTVVMRMKTPLRARIRKRIRSSSCSAHHH